MIVVAAAAGLAVIIASGWFLLWTRRLEYRDHREPHIDLEGRKWRIYGLGAPDNSAGQ